jgi:hypothetical protein
VNQGCTVGQSCRSSVRRHKNKQTEIVDLIGVVVDLIGRNIVEARNDRRTCFDPRILSHSWRRLRSSNHRYHDHSRCRHIRLKWL